jgi:sterol 3beta-glucosyltransferase
MFTVSVQETTQRGMRVLLLAAGSHGDVRPMVALADRLVRAGHTPLLVAPRVFGPLAVGHRVPFAPLDLDMTAVAARMRADAPGPLHFLAFARSMGTAVRPALGALWEAAAAFGPDVIVHHPVLPLGQHLAERLDIPAVLAPPLPAFVPTGAFASPVWALRMPLPGFANRLTYRLTNAATGHWCRAAVAQWRADTLGLTPGRERMAVRTLHPFSRHVLPRPHDWPSDTGITGYWFLPAPEDRPLPQKVVDFLDDGPPPVYIGFGSMPLRSPGRVAGVIERVLERLDVRAVVASGYVAPQKFPTIERALVVRELPHERVLPLMRAVVHHGGAGTTGAAVAAGIPQVVCPVGFDQPFWAARMRDLGVSGGTVPLHTLGTAHLESALRLVLEDDGFRRRAAGLGERVRAEDGTGTALAHLEQIVNAPERIGASL